MTIEMFLSQTGVLLEIPKRHYLFRQGDTNTSLYYVKEGLLKAYYLTEDGKEFVKSFIVSEDIIGSLTAAYSKTTCSFNLVSLEKAKVIKIDFDSVYEFALANQKAGHFLINRLLALAMKKERREFEFLCCTAEERYLLLQKQSPELLNRVTQNDIARYLGITPVALSRIRGRNK